VTQLSLDAAHFVEDFEHLGSLGGGEHGGVNRIAYSRSDLEARAWLEDEMRGLGMDVQRDAAGNTIATYPGREQQLLPIALGSHTDTVPDGGRFDGALGVVAAVACVRSLSHAQVQLRHPLQVINFEAEEATMAGATFGSRAMVGALELDAVQQLAWDGRPISIHLQEAGLDPAKLGAAVRSTECLACYLELHCEQGNVLDSAGVPAGIVEGIVGIRRYSVTFNGYANHAGTTPMSSRRDALVMAAPFVLTVRDVAVAHEIVGTVGAMQIRPGSPNVIPGRVTLAVEIRSLMDSRLDDTQAELRKQAERAGASFELISRKPPVRSSAALMDALTRSCERLGIPWLRLPSGAGHDAGWMASITEQAMLFVPSRDGVSHSPEEFSQVDQCVAGARVLLGAVLDLDEELT
jgi:beta-ureidopropionase / N-carbamoyl-L-amino-acid hydrolase